MTQIALQSQAFLRDPHPALMAALEAGPMMDMRMPIIGKVASTVSHAASLEMLKDTDRFAVDARNAGHKSVYGMPLPSKTLRILALNLLSQDDPDHRRLRRLVDGPFRRANVEALRPAIHTQVTRLLDEMKASGNTDLVSGLARPLPLQVICDMLGMGADSRKELIRFMDGFASGGTVLGVVRAMLKLGWVRRFFQAEFAAVRANPRPGLMSELVHAEEDGMRMSEDELFAMVFVLFVAGHETTTHLMSSGVFTLLSVPGAMATLRAAGEDALLPAVDELMRYCGPVQITKPRFVIEEMEYYGRQLKRGEKVMALLAAGNLDLAVFDDPLELNLARKPNRHLGWGGGPHLCLGLHLAKMEVEIVLAALMERYPHLALGGEVSSLKWVKRAGTRGLVRLPLVMG